jgi:hypothetical protein
MSGNWVIEKISLHFTHFTCPFLFWLFMRDGACLASSFEDITMLLKWKRWAETARINQRISDMLRRKGAGWWSLAITTCWNPSIIEIYWIKLKKLNYALNLIRSYWNRYMIHFTSEAIFWNISVWLWFNRHEILFCQKFFPFMDSIWNFIIRRAR